MTSLQSPGSGSSAARFSDLRGVTVRNTFLEFEDGVEDLPDSGFARQASEPAKPFNRQVSEQTTTGSGATLEEGSTEPEEYAVLASYMGGAPQAGPGSAGGGVSSRPGGAGCGSVPNFASASLQAAINAASSGSPGMSMMGLQAPCTGLQPIIRFCPNCGAEAEPNHRFCPYCCYQLQSFPAAGAAVQPQPMTAPAPVTADAGSSGSTFGAPNLLHSLMRFRFVEASAADVEYAQALCMNLTHGGKV